MVIQFSYDNQTERKNSNIFGGFITGDWVEIDNLIVLKPDSNAFIFSLTNKDNEPRKMKIDPNKNICFCH
jgi:hypothetical protein